MILRGQVLVDGKEIVKPSHLVSADACFSVAEEATRYVSRGAFKLVAALDAFDFDPKDRTALDVGASTGGFTQVLLERGAGHVTAVDVGRDQLAGKIRTDPRVNVLEGFDARRLTRDQVSDEISAIVADVSFISLTKALPAALELACRGCWLVALIKPQFEVGREAIGKGGIVRDERARDRAVEHVRNWLAEQPCWTVEGIVQSPITGTDGNQEYLIGATKSDSKSSG